jgi:hypothetical protein
MRRAIASLFSLLLLLSVWLVPGSAFAACTPIVVLGETGVNQIISYQDENGNSCTPSADEQVAAENLHTTIQQGAVAECGWFSEPIKCFLAPMISGIGGVILGISGQVLALAGYLFDLLIYHIIVAFGQTIKTLGLIDGIHTAWTVLRDISNIVIIGMFTFIAISIIIGNQTFGEKKLVAKVLVVAVLINFSLLFAKIIIDTSNFFAYQIYKSMAPEGSGVSSDSVLPSGTGGNIAGKFLTIIGATTIFEGVSSAVGVADRAIADGERAKNVGFLNSVSGAAKGFFYGLVGGILLLVAAGVLLYGCFLIAARAILFIFLMLVSALAFATYMVPQLSGGTYGWKTWWQSLLNASLFGPLLMVLLYVSLIIITPAANKSNGGTIGGILGDPSTVRHEDNWAVIVVFILGIGMLYVSFKVANSFAGKIAGFSTAGIIPGMAFGASSRLTGMGARLALGWPASGIANILRDRGWGTGKGVTGAMKRKILGGTARLANAPLDPFQGKIGKQFASNFGIPKFMQDMKTGQKGWVDSQKAAAKRAEELAGKTGLTKDGKKKFSEEEEKKIRAEIEKERTPHEARARQHQSEKEAAQNKQAEAEANIKATQTPERLVVDTEIRKQQDARVRLEAEKARSEKEYESDLRVGEARIVNAKDDTERSALKAELGELMDRQQATMEAFAKNIQEAQDGVIKSQEKLAELDNEAKTKAAELLKPTLERIEREASGTKSELEKLREREKGIGTKVSDALHTREMQDRKNILSNWSNLYGAWTHPAESQLKGAYEEHHKHEELEAAARALGKGSGHGDDHGKKEGEHHDEHKPDVAHAPAPAHPPTAKPVATPGAGGGGDHGHH